LLNDGLFTEVQSTLTDSL